MRDLASDDGLSADLLAWAQRRAEAIVQGIGGDVDGALDHLLSATLADWSPGPVDELGEGELGGAERELAGEAHEGENIDEVAQEAVEAEPVGVDALVDDDDAEPVGVEALVDDDDAEPVGVDALVDDDEAEPVGVEALVDDDEAAPAGAEAVVDGDAPADVDARGDDDANVEPVAELSDDEGLGLAARFARAARAAEAERAQAVVSEATQEGALLELGGAEEEAPELEVELIEPAAAEQVVAVEAELHAPVDEDEHLGPPLLPGLGDAVAEYAAVDEYVDSDAGLVEEAAATADAEDEYVDPLAGIDDDEPAAQEAAAQEDEYVDPLEGIDEPAAQEAAAQEDEYVDPLEGIDDDEPAKEAAPTQAAPADDEYVDPLEGIDDDETAKEAAPTQAAAQEDEYVDPLEGIDDDETAKEAAPTQAAAQEDEYVDPLEGLAEETAAEELAAAAEDEYEDALAGLVDDDDDDDTSAPFNLGGGSDVESLARVAMEAGARGDEAEEAVDAEPHAAAAASDDADEPTVEYTASDVHQSVQAAVAELGPPLLPGLGEELGLPPPPPSEGDAGDGYGLGLPVPLPDDQWNQQPEWSERSFLLGIPDDETIAKAAAELQAEREAAAAREADAPVLRRREGSSRAQAAAPSGASPRAPKPELERVEKKLSRKEKRRRRKEKRRRKREDKKSAVVVLAKPRKRGSEIEEIDDFEEIVDDGAVREPTAEISADEIEEFEDIDEIDDEEIEEIDDYEEIDDDDFEEIDDDDD